MVTRDRVASALFFCELHIDDFGELLPSVFLGAWTLEQVRQYRENPLYSLSASVSEYLEDALKLGEPAVYGLIDLSFFENIADKTDVLDRLASDLRPVSRDRLKHWVNFYKRQIR